jgi:hypothetical protein
MWYYKWIAYGLILSGVVGYFFYSQNKIEALNQEKIVLKIAFLEKEAGLELCEESKGRQAAALNSLAVEKQSIQQTSDRYLKIFKKHNLNKLAQAKPGLIEDRVNAGSQRLLKEMENETAINTPK